MRSAIANSRYCHVTYKLLYPSIRVRTAPPVSVRVNVSFSLRILFCMCGLRTFAIADLNRYATRLRQIFSVINIFKNALNLPHASLANLDQMVHQCT